MLSSYARPQIFRLPLIRPNDTEGVMAKTLITTPFPTTEEVGRLKGVSASRVRQIQDMMARDVFPLAASRQKTVRKMSARVSAKKRRP